MYLWFIWDESLNGCEKMSVMEQIYFECEFEEKWLYKAMEILNTEVEIKEFYREYLGACFIWKFREMSTEFSNIAQGKAIFDIAKALQNKEIKVNEKMRYVWKELTYVLDEKVL